MAPKLVEFVALHDQENYGRGLEVFKKHPALNRWWGGLKRELGGRDISVEGLV